MRFLLCCLIGFAGILAGAERLPADTRWAVHIDATRLLAGQAGAAVRAAAARQPHAARLSMLAAVTGTDLLTDLRSLTVGGGEGPESVVLVLRGRFDRQRLETVAMAAADHRSVPAGALTVHAWSHEGRPAAGCLAAPDLLVLGAGVERVLATVAAVDGGPAADLPVPAGWDGSAIVLAAAEGVGDLGRGPESAILRAVRTAAGRLREDGSDLVLDLNATAVGEEQARRIQDGLRGLAALIALRPPEDLPPAAAEALAGLTVERQGATVAATARMPMATALDILARRLAEDRPPRPLPGDAGGPRGPRGPHP